MGLDPFLFWIQAKSGPYKYKGKFQNIKHTHSVIQRERERERERERLKNLRAGLPEPERRSNESTDNGRSPMTDLPLASTVYRSLTEHRSDERPISDLR